MTRLRIVRGKLSIITHKDHNIYAREGNIVFNSQKQIHETGTDLGTSFDKSSFPIENLISSPYLFFNKNGFYLTGPTGNSQRVYLTDQNLSTSNQKTKEDWEKVKSNSIKLSNKVDDEGISYSDFKHFSATILGESSVGFGVLIEGEILALACANRNFKKWYKKVKKKTISYREVIQKTGAYAVGNPQYNYYMNKSESERNSNKSMLYANAAVIYILMNGSDITNGAVKWSGIDMASDKEKWREGYHFTDSSHDIFFLGNNPKNGKGWTYKWKSTIAFSGINSKKENKNWTVYKEKTTNWKINRLIFQNRMDKNEFYKTQTGHKFGTVFCTLTESYNNSQGGEFY